MLFIIGASSEAQEASSSVPLGESLLLWFFIKLPLAWFDQLCFYLKSRSAEHWPSAIVEGIELAFMSHNSDNFGLFSPLLGRWSWGLWAVVRLGRSFVSGLGTADFGSSRLFSVAGLGSPDTRRNDNRFLSGATA